MLRLLDQLTSGLNLIGSALIVGLMLLIGADVVGRVALGAPISGVPEIVSLAIVAIVFLQIGAVAREGRLTRSDALLNWLKARAPQAAAGLETLFDVATIGVVGVIVWQTWPLAMRAWERSEFVGAIGDFTAPTWPVKFIIVLGASMLILQTLAAILRRHVEAAR